MLIPGSSMVLVVLVSCVAFVLFICVLCIVPLLIVSLDYPLDAAQCVYYTSENTVTVISDFTLTVSS